MTLVEFIGLVLLLAPGLLFAGITLYNHQQLPKERRTALNGICTIDEAVGASRESGKTGWELVTFAQQLVAQKFSYSRHNAWDSPAQAFERGLGYCAQQALALQLIYQHLGIEAWTVHAFRNRFPSRKVHGIYEPASISGHVWLRVCIGDEVREVCPGHEDNSPGVIHFVPLSKVLRYTRTFHLLAHLGCVAENFRRDISAQKAAQTQLAQHQNRHV